MELFSCRTENNVTYQTIRTVLAPSINPTVLFAFHASPALESYRALCRGHRGRNLAHNAHDAGRPLRFSYVFHRTQFQIYI